MKEEYLRLRKLVENRKWQQVVKAVNKGVTSQEATL